MKKFSCYLAALALAAIAFTLTAFAGDTEKVLLNVQGGAYGRDPGNVVQDAAGNIYGILAVGGNTTCSTTCGILYKLTPGTNGMTETIIHVFTGGDDGAQPHNLLIDANGNLYVAAQAGGSTKCLQGCGAIDEFSPIKSGGYKMTVLYDFTGGTEGGRPSIDFMDSQGNIYGFLIHSYGLVFELSPSSSGTWTEKSIYSFTGGDDGAFGFPQLMDASGNIIGTAGSGGTGTACNGGCGVIFQLSPNSNGTWTESILYNFTGAPDGAFPVGLVQDSAGNLFGTTSYGGDGTSSTCTELTPPGCGTVFELQPSSGGYTETILHSFNDVLDGGYPSEPLIDSSGDLYIPNLGGGVGTGGVVLEFTPPTSGPWMYTILHSFGADGLGGTGPESLFLGSGGIVYGQTVSGGTKNDGVVFELSPTAN